jgi:hypothetical protein
MDVANRHDTLAGAGDGSHRESRQDDRGHSESG